MIWIINIYIILIIDISIYKITNGILNIVYKVDYKINNVNIEWLLYNTKYTIYYYKYKRLRYEVNLIDYYIL